MSTNIKDVIAELDRISALVSRFCDIGDEIDELKEKNDRETREIYYEYRPELPASMPVFKTLQAEVEPFNSSHAKGIKIGLLGFLAALVIWFISKTSMWFGVIGYAFFAMIIFAIWFIVAYRKYSADKKEYDAVAKRRYEYEEIIKNSHAQDTLNFQAELSDYYTKYQLFDHKFNECCDAYVNAHNKLVEESEQVQNTLSEVTLLSEEHIVLARRIGDILKSGRADTFKEALNLAIAEKRDEEFKAQQLAEEARRTQIAEQQAYDNMLHNQRMEREAAAQTQQAQTQARIAEAQLKATEQQNAQLKKLLDNQNRR